MDLFVFIWKELLVLGVAAHKTSKIDKYCLSSFLKKQAWFTEKHNLISLLIRGQTGHSPEISKTKLLVFFQ